MTLELTEINLPRLGKANIPESFFVNQPESDNPFMYVDEDGEFIEPIKNPFSCKGAYLLACEDVIRAIKAYKEVDGDITTELKIAKWLEKLAYEYI